MSNFESVPMYQMLLKELLFLAMVAILALTTILFKRADFRSVHYGEHLCEFVLNLGQWFMRCLLKKKFKDASKRLITKAHL